MTIIEATKTCFGKYAVFSGRATRSEFWKFVLFFFLVNIALVLVNSAIFGPQIVQNFSVTIDGAGEQSQNVSVVRQYNGGLLGNVFSLACFLPWLAASWRRLHDMGRAGWHSLLPLVSFPLAFLIMSFSTTKDVQIDVSQLPDGVVMPETTAVPESPLLFLIGWLIAVASLIAVTWWLTRPSQPGSNKYGPNPHEVTP